MFGEVDHEQQSPGPDSAPASPILLALEQQDGIALTAPALTPNEVDEELSALDPNMPSIPKSTDGPTSPNKDPNPKPPALSSSFTICLDEFSPLSSPPSITVTSTYLNYYNTNQNENSPNSTSIKRTHELDPVLILDSIPQRDFSCMVSTLTTSDGSFPLPIDDPTCSPSLGDDAFYEEGPKEPNRPFTGSPHEFQEPLAFSKYDCTKSKPKLRLSSPYTRRTSKGESSTVYHSGSGFESREPGFGSGDAGFGSGDAGFGSREPGSGSREPGSGSREPGSGSREPGFESRGTGFGSRDAGFGSRDAGFGSRDAGFGSGDAGFGSGDAGFRSREPGSGSTEPGSASTEPRSGSIQPGRLSPPSLPSTHSRSPEESPQRRSMSKNLTSPHSSGSYRRPFGSGNSLRWNADGVNSSSEPSSGNMVPRVNCRRRESESAVSLSFGRILSNTSSSNTSSSNTSSSNTCLSPASTVSITPSASASGHRHIGRFGTSKASDVGQVYTLTQSEMDHQLGVIVGLQKELMETQEEVRRFTENSNGTTSTTSSRITSPKSPHRVLTVWDGSHYRPEGGLHKGSINLSMVSTEEARSQKDALLLSPNWASPMISSASMSSPTLFRENTKQVSFGQGLKLPRAHSMVLTGPQSSRPDSLFSQSLAIQVGSARTMSMRSIAGLSALNPNLGLTFAESENPILGSVTRSRFREEEDCSTRDSNSIQTNHRFSRSMTGFLPQEDFQERLFTPYKTTTVSQIQSLREWLRDLPQKDPLGRFTTEQIEELFNSWEQLDGSWKTAIDQLIEHIELRREGSLEEQISKTINLTEYPNISTDEAFALFVYSFEFFEQSDGLSYPVDAKPKSCQHQLYKEFNRMCRERGTPATQDKDKAALEREFQLFRPFAIHIQTALAKLPMVDGVFFRGADYINHDQYPKDKPVVWGGFTSSSLCHREAAKFIDKKGEEHEFKPGNTLFLLLATKARPVYWYSVFPEELEFIFELNSKWVVANIMPDSFKKYLNLNAEVLIMKQANAEIDLNLHISALDSLCSIRSHFLRSYVVPSVRKHSHGPDSLASQLLSLDDEVEKFVKDDKLKVLLIASREHGGKSSCAVYLSACTRRYGSIWLFVSVPEGDQEAQTRILRRNGILRYIHEAFNFEKQAFDELMTEKVVLVIDGLPDQSSGLSGMDILAMNDFGKRVKLIITRNEHTLDSHLPKGSTSGLKSIRLVEFDDAQTLAYVSRRLVLFSDLENLDMEDDGRLEMALIVQEATNVITAIDKWDESILRRPARLASVMDGYLGSIPFESDETYESKIDSMHEELIVVRGKWSRVWDAVKDTEVPMSRTQSASPLEVVSFSSLSVDGQGFNQELESVKHKFSVLKHCVNMEMAMKEELLQLQVHEHEQWCGILMAVSESKAIMAMDYQDREVKEHVLSVERAGHDRIRQLSSELATLTQKVQHTLAVEKALAREKSRAVAGTLEIQSTQQAHMIKEDEQRAWYALMLMEWKSRIHLQTSQQSLVQQERASRLEINYKRQFDALTQELQSLQETHKADMRRMLKEKQKVEAHLNRENDQLSEELKRLQSERELAVQNGGNVDVRALELHCGKLKQQIHIQEQQIQEQNMDANKLKCRWEEEQVEKAALLALLERQKEEHLKMEDHLRQEECRQAEDKFGLLLQKESQRLEGERQERRKVEENLMALLETERVARQKVESDLQISRSSEKTWQEEKSSMAMQLKTWQEEKSNMAMQLNSTTLLGREMAKEREWMASRIEELESEKTKLESMLHDERTQMTARLQTQKEELQAQWQLEVTTMDMAMQMKNSMVGLDLAYKEKEIHSMMQEEKKNAVRVMREELGKMKTVLQAKHQAQIQEKDRYIQYLEHRLLDHTHSDPLSHLSYPMAGVSQISVLPSPMPSHCPSISPEPSFSRSQPSSDPHRPTTPTQYQHVQSSPSHSLNSSLSPGSGQPRIAVDLEF